MLHSPCPILTMSVNRGTMIFGGESWVILVVHDRRHLKTRFWKPFGADMEKFVPQKPPGQSQLNSFSMLPLSDP
jgi:hypothetical protein